MGFKVKKKSKTRFKAPSAYSGGAVGGTGGGDRPVKRRKKNGGRPGLVIFLIVLAVLVLALAATAFLGVREISGKRGGAATDIVVTVPDGASTGDVALVLKQNGIIKNDLLFKLYSRIKKADGSYQLGDHTVNSTLSYDEIIEVLQQITIKDIETFTVTFPEGTTTLKMAMMLEEQGVCTKEEFVDACNNETYDVSFFDQISHENKFIALEGFLFPDTYEFEVGSSLHDMILQMLKNFEAKVLTPDRKAQIEASGYTLEEIMVMSSIVEKESVGEGSYAKVAAVFYNRLGSSDFPCLESDTSCDWRKRDLADQEDYYGGYFPGVLQYYYGGYENIPAGVRDGYDTFSHEGLIVGAICNPGLIAIDGTLNPEADWPYYFFFTGPDKETFYWSKTADEHARQWNEAYP